MWAFEFLFRLKTTAASPQVETEWQTTLSLKSSLATIDGRFDIPMIDTCDCFRVLGPRRLIIPYTVHVRRHFDAVIDPCGRVYDPERLRADHLHGSVPCGFSTRLPSL
jgi:hypothetical protein